MNYYNTPPPKSNPIIEYMPLPRTACIPEGIGIDACPWLDEYIAFSKEWSPRSFDGYHEAVGLWVLSTIAARRVAFDLGKRRYTNLYIALIGRSSIPAKSSAARIGKDVLYKGGLDWLLLPDTCTPQKLINEMVIQVPSQYLELEPEQQEQIKRELAFAGQRGWYYDEFGMLMSGMMRPDGVMADFRGLLRRFDDTEERYVYATIHRGHETIIRPYLALCAILTVSDLVPYARSGSALWGDGFLARFVLVAPSIDYHKEGRFPVGPMNIPASILTPLVEWHQWLGQPKVEISDSNASVSPLPARVVELSPQVYEAYYAYDEALRDMITTAGGFDLDGNYARLPEKALRIAALFASLQQSPSININHWARAQGIAERLRMNLHDLYRQLNEVNVPVREVNEQKVLRAINAKGNPTKREIEQCTGLLSNDVQKALDILLDDKKITPVEDGRTTRFIRSNQDDQLLVEKSS